MAPDLWTPRRSRLDDARLFDLSSPPFAGAQRRGLCAPSTSRLSNPQLCWALFLKNGSGHLPPYLLGFVDVHARKPPSLWSMRSISCWIPVLSPSTLKYSGGFVGFGFQDHTGTIEFHEFVHLLTAGASIERLLQCSSSCFQILP